LNRRSFLRHSACLAAGGSLIAQTRRRPNILFVQTDDQRFDAFGLANPLVQTPNLDRVAQRGILFRNSFVVTAVCSASRAAVLSGRYGSLNGVPGLGGGLRDGETTFVPALKKEGYYTGHIGKWHLSNPGTPTAAGFDEELHFTGNGPHFDRRVVGDGKPVVAEGFIEDYLASRAISFLERAARRDAPFFLTLATQVPHMDNKDRWLPREETLARYRDIPVPLPANWKNQLEGKPAYLRTGRHHERGVEFGYQDPDKLKDHIRRYWASITDLDTSLGKVFDTLGRLGLRDNTYIIMTGDNGWFLGEHGFSSKVLPYEEAIRVPLFIAGPGITVRQERAPVLNIDLAPTFLDIAGAEKTSRMQGRSLVPSWTGPLPKPRTRFVYEAIEPTLGSWPLVALREERWKYVQTFDIDRRSELAFEELYDLHDDPGEIRNRSQDTAAKSALRQMREQLAGLRSAIGRGNQV